MRTAGTSGTQIAFLTFAVVLLAVPLSAYVGTVYGNSIAQRELIGRALPLLIGAAILLSFPSLRRIVAIELLRPIPGPRRAEVVLVAIAKVPLAIAASGGLALWIWLTQGNPVLEQRMWSDEREQLAFAFSGEGIFLFFFLGMVVAPVVEELVFRGFLYRAWERRWGWAPAMILVSTIFGLYHTHFASAFAASVVFICVLRRTGSLQAPIIVHAFGNAMLWYPFAGHLLVPSSERAIGDISTWAFQLACLVYALIALPTYLCLAAAEDRRDRVLGAP